MLQFTDLVLNGGDSGPSMAETMRRDPYFQPGMYRPFIDDKGNRCVILRTNKMKQNTQTGEYEPVHAKVNINALRRRGINNPVWNATSLRLRDWAAIDKAVIRASRERLRAWADLKAASSESFDGYGKMTYEYEAMSDFGEAFWDFDLVTEPRGDSPLFKLRSLPLPIAQSAFSYTDRRLAISENSNTPLRLTSFEAHGRRVAELIEKTYIGVTNTITYGTQTAGYGTHDLTSTVFGMLTYTNRLTKTNLTVPTGSNPNATVTDILAMLTQLRNAKQYGNYMLYHSTDWDDYLDNDYAFTNGSNWAVNPNMTLRDRIRAIDGIIDVRRLDYLTPTATNSHAFTLLAIQLASNTVTALTGMELITMMWPSHGNAEWHFRVAAMELPLFVSDYSGNTGLLHARTA